MDLIKCKKKYYFLDLKNLVIFKMQKKFLLVFLVLVFTQGVFANDTNDTNTSTEIIFEYSENYNYYFALSKEIRSEIVELRDQGFIVGRLADELFVLEQLLENNKNREEQGESPSYARLEEKVSEIREILKEARLAQDELRTLEIAIEEVDKELDASEAWQIYEKGVQEFNDQRYENVTDLVEDAYEKIIEIQSIEARTSAIADAATRNLVGFLRENWINILLIVGTPLVLLFIFRKKIKRYLLRKKVDENNSEINVLKNELRKAQDGYFVKADLPEEEYQIKVKIYSQKIRDLNRENAVLLEDIAGTYREEKLRNEVKKRSKKYEKEGKKFDNEKSKKVDKKLDNDLDKLVKE
jgi:flagellar motility protein MotE (MotC chaperone)